MIPSLPSPVPILREGLALGARVHSGFARTWNWLTDIFKNADRYIVTAVDGRTGGVSIVAGSGIDVVAAGNTITIGLGSGASSELRGTPALENVSGAEPSCPPAVRENVFRKQSAG